MYEQMVTGNMTNLFKAETRIDIKFNHTLHFQKLMVKKIHILRYSSLKHPKTTNDWQQKLKGDVHSFCHPQHLFLE